MRNKKKCNKKVLGIKVPLPPNLSNITTTHEPTVSTDAFTSSLLERLNIRSMSSARRNRVSPETPFEKWDIGLATAKRTTRMTTQTAVKTVEHPSLQRRFRTNDRQLRYRRLNTTFFSGIYFDSIKSTRGNTCTQIWTNDILWARFDPMSSKKHAHHSSKKVFKNDRVSSKIVMDDALGSR